MEERKIEEPAGEVVRACPFIPPVITRGTTLNPQQPVAHMNPCLRENCQLWSAARKDCGCKAIEPK
jgi:hypothetical protein